MNDTYLMPTYARQPLTFIRGEGIWLYDTNGDAYLDAVSGVGVCGLGHCHPEVTRVMQAQAQTLVHTSNLYHIDHQQRLAEKLCQISGMERVFFGNSGAEANEAAIKLARLYGHNKGIEVPAIIVLEKSFHGRTLATLSATGNAAVQAGFGPLVEGFVRVPWNDAQAVREAIQANPNIVAVFVEPIQGEGGVHVPADNYLPELRQICDEHELLLMLDEVQTGNGRTGDYFAAMGAGVTPDVLTTAKGLGNGFPIGACLVAGKATGLFGPGNHGSTYGGNPFGCAVGGAVVDTLVNQVLPDLTVRGEYLRDALRQKLSHYPFFVEVRGKGFMVGIELSQACADMVNLAREQKLLVNVTGGNVVRLLPPLVMSREEIDILVERLALAMDAFAQQLEEA